MPHAWLAEFIRRKLLAFRPHHNLAAPLWGRAAPALMLSSVFDPAKGAYDAALTALSNDQINNAVERTAQALLSAKIKSFPNYESYPESFVNALGGDLTYEQRVHLGELLGGSPVLGVRSPNVPP
jgi:hypothetical protein